MFLSSISAAYLFHIETLITATALGTDKDTQKWFLLVCHLYCTPPWLRDEPTSCSCREIQTSPFGVPASIRDKKKQKIPENWGFKTAALTLPRELFCLCYRLSCEITGTSFWQGRVTGNNFHLPTTLLYITVAHVQYTTDVQWSHKEQVTTKIASTKMCVAKS